MVRKISDSGGVYHEPPYTEEEQMALYKSFDMKPGASFSRPGPAAVAAGAKSAPKAPQDPKPRQR